MDSKKFFKELIPEVKHDEFQFILISDFIKTNNTFKNVKSIPRLMPPNRVMQDFVNDNMKEYKKGYLKYLQNPNIEAFISIIVKAAVVNDMKIVLLCSHSENEFKYLKMLTEYIEAVYKMQTYSFKDYMKDPEKVSKLKNKEEITKILGKKFEKMERSGVDLNTTIDKEDYVKQLIKLGKKGMQKLAKSRNIKIDKDLGKKEMAKKLAKKLLAS